MECKKRLAIDDDGNVLQGQDMAIKVDEPCFHEEDSYYKRDSWRHLNCLDTRHPSIKKLFQCGDDGIILSAFQHTADTSPYLLVR